MGGLRRLIGEVHRRSLWQVLGIYLAGSFVVLQVLDAVGDTIGLPDWFAPVAVGLLIVGLPIVLATAFVQEGLGSRASQEPDEVPSAGPPPAPTSESRPPEPEPPAPSGPEAQTPAAQPAVGAHHRLFTWRNALLGGAAGFTLLGILTAGYLVMRTTGIGPAATLVAQGVLEEGAAVVLADFESPDAELADVVTGALRIDLLQSPTIRIVPRAELGGALERMQRAEDAVITAQMARELAIREGYAAVIEGEIGVVGSGYVLTARILGGEEWTPLAGFRQTAKSQDDLIDAIEGLSRDIRDKAGESLRTVRGGKRLEQVTTASLEALRAYTRGEALEEAGDRRGALERYERAVETDPDFAMAHRKIGVHLGNIGIRRPDQVAALTRAYELRDRLPASERYLAEGYYHAAVSGDRDAAIRAYEGLLAADPENTIAHNNLGVLYRVRGRLEEAEELFQRRLAHEPHATAHGNLIQTRFMLGGAPAASAAADSAIAVLPDARFVFEDLRVASAAAAGEYDRADSLAGLFAERFRRPVEMVMAGHQRYRLAAIRGRLREAERYVAELDVAPGFLGNPIMMATLVAELARVRGDLTEAARIVTARHEQIRDAVPPGDRFYEGSIYALTRAGAAGEAERLLAEWVAEVPENQLGVYGRDERRSVSAQLASARGDADEAIRLWGIYERECPGTCVPSASLGLAGAHEARGDVPAAIAEYERFLAYRETDRWWWDSSERGPTYERLGQLYEGEGDLERAAEYYARFTELWAEADAELQPRVRAAQERLEEILRARG